MGLLRHPVFGEGDQLLRAALHRYGKTVRRKGSGGGCGTKPPLAPLGRLGDFLHPERDLAELAPAGLLSRPGGRAPSQPFLCITGEKTSLTCSPQPWHGGSGRRRCCAPADPSLPSAGYGGARHRGWAWGTRQSWAPPQGEPARPGGLGDSSAYEALRTKEVSGASEESPAA